MNVIDKSFVKTRFDSGLHTYSKEAMVQKGSAKELISELCQLELTNHSRLFEIGCGTGFLTQHIIEDLKANELIVNDISCTSKQIIQGLEKKYDNHIQFLEGDAEIIEYPQQLDAVISGSTIQWLENKKIFFDKIHQSLKPNGVLAFSSFGNDNFKEIRSLTGIGLDYLSLNEFTEMLSNNFKILTCREWLEVKEFDKPIDALRHMKRTGVNGIGQNNFGKKQLTQFTSDYIKNFSNESGQVKLTYNPIIIIATKT